MKDFGLSELFLAGIIIGIGAIVVFMLRFRLLQYCKISAQKSLLPFKTKDIPFYYSSNAVKQECIRKFFHLPPAMESILMKKAEEDIGEAIRFAYNNWVGSRKYQELLKMYFYGRLVSWQKISSSVLNRYRLPLFASGYYRALFFYLLAQDRLYETDMQNASIYASKSLNLFQKLGFVYEQGETYLLLAQIYRITGIYDVAQTMLREAKKCFEQVQFSAKIAETVAYLGLLEFSRENFTEAAKTLLSAADIALKNNLMRTYADVLNWLGLTYYLLGELDKAEDCFRTVYKIIPSAEGQAYAAEMLARVMFKINNLQEALHYVCKALNIGKNISDKTSVPENLYLKAEILHRLQKNGQSARILTNLIRQKYPPTSTFYPANAYTLLGLIKLERNETDAAKTLFKQAADLEHGKNRLKGAAIDYNNLAEIAIREGNSDEADIYLKQALEHAENAGDEELAAHLRNKLK